MKPKNFPERKRQRQLGALARLQQQPSLYLTEQQKREIEALQQRTAVNRRDVRTKKRRA